MKINVTQDHIDKAVRKSIFNDPVALAVQDIVKGNFYTTVGSGFDVPFYLHIRDGSDIVSIELGQDIAEFIRNFDTKPHVNFTPKEFEIEIPERLLNENIYQR